MALSLRISDPLSSINRRPQRKENKQTSWTKTSLGFPGTHVKPRLGLEEVIAFVTEGETWLRRRPSPSVHQRPCSPHDSVTGSPTPRLAPSERVAPGNGNVAVCSVPTVEAAALVGWWHSLPVSGSPVPGRVQAWQAGVWWGGCRGESWTG